MWHQEKPWGMRVEAEGPELRLPGFDLHFPI